MRDFALSVLAGFAIATAASRTPGRGSQLAADVHLMKVKPWIARLVAATDWLETAIRQRNRNHGQSRIAQGIDDVSFWIGRLMCDAIAAGEAGDEDLYAEAIAVVLRAQKTIRAAKVALVGEPGWKAKTPLSAEQRHGG